MEALNKEEWNDSSLSIPFFLALKSPVTVKNDNNDVDNNNNSNNNYIYIYAFNYMLLLLYSIIN